MKAYGSIAVGGDPGSHVSAGVTIRPRGAHAPGGAS